MAVPSTLYDPFDPNWEYFSDDGTTEVDAAYMNARDSEIVAIEESLGVGFVPGTTKPLVDYLRVEEDDQAPPDAPVFLANKVGSNVRVAVGPVDFSSGPPDIPLGWLHVRPTGVTTTPTYSLGPAAETLVLENATNVGVTMLTDSGNVANIWFASAVNKTRAPVVPGRLQGIPSGPARDCRYRSHTDRRQRQRAGAGG